MNLFATIIAAFLLGSIPTGYLVARLRGIDIRKHGSGNIGATNVFRTLGKPLGVFVFLADASKGFAAVWMASMMTPGDSSGLPGILAAVAVIAGHNYTPWLGFKGGKGIATSAGVLIALAPWAALAGIVVWSTVFFMTRYVSLASIAAATSLPVTTGLLWFSGRGGNGTLFLFTLLISALAIWRHRPNIQRLRAGTEPRFAKKTGHEHSG